MAGRLTDLAGSSAYVLGGLVVYSNEAKVALAGVPAELIAAPRRRLARGGAARWPPARASASAPTSASASPGIAGPGGGDAGEARRHGLPVRVLGRRRAAS